MRILITAETQFQIPPELLGQLMEGFVAWRARHRAKMDNFYFFAGGGGGVGVANVADEVELNQVMLEWPFLPFSKVSYRPVVDGDVGLKQWQAALAAVVPPGR